MHAAIALVRQLRPAHGAAALVAQMRHERAVAAAQVEHAAARGNEAR